jgi:hypothetical protein
MQCHAGNEFEIRSIEVQLRVEVCSSIIMVSLQMSDYRRCLGLVQEVWKLRKHLLRKFTDLLVRPPPRFSQREDRRDVLRGQSTGWRGVHFRAFGVGVSIGSLTVAISIGVTVPAGNSLRNVEVHRVPKTTE